MTRIPKENEVIYFPGTPGSGIGPIVSKIEKIGENEEGPIVYINKYST